ncbi:hypothetical protein XIS1_490013 [Xenorhabdus innexi]|uniref:Uncharacterized protein n=1 Tax=Xenorhabdus innexi TaxID=290109 RepID=A0A1N6MYT3_9GAMM|nr:hypothetical protein XIS1_490013 [Xenorhabdus innexi]
MNIFSALTDIKVLSSSLNNLIGTGISALIALFKAAIQITKYFVQG